MPRKKRHEGKKHRVQARMSKADMKHLRVFALIGLFLFVLLLIVIVLSATVYPRILVSPAYNQKAVPIALVVALYIGASFIFRVFFDDQTAETRRENTKFRNFILVLIAIFLVG